MSEWRSACVIAPYPPELLPNTPRRPLPPHSKCCSIAGSISCSRKSSQAPIEAELMYWLPSSRVKQSGKATTTGGIRLGTNLAKVVLDQRRDSLDPEQSLAGALTGGSGDAVMLVSHDRDFLDRIVTSVIVSEGKGRWIEYAGGYTDMLAQRAAAPRVLSPKARRAVPPRPATQSSGLPAGRPRRMNFNDGRT